MIICNIYIYIYIHTYIYIHIIIPYSLTHGHVVSHIQERKDWRPRERRPGGSKTHGGGQRSPGTEAARRRVVSTGSQGTLLAGRASTAFAGAQISGPRGDQPQYIREPPRY